MQELIEDQIFQPAFPASWLETSKPHSFCPGCGHGIVLKCLGQAIDELGIVDKLLYGCDIGCSLLSWNFFQADCVQTHHGRTTPFIAGAKRVRPDLVGVAYMGDGGGYAIGSQHLVNAVLRNEKITIVLVNNVNYAMTGGQMAPTTLPGQVTETSPYGKKVEEAGPPLLGPEMVAAISQEGAYVARGTISNIKQLTKFIRKGLENQMAGRGISFIEALSSCPTNWKTNAEQTWRFVEKDMTAYFKVGELKLPEAKGEEHAQNP
ncbi:MAG: thiamine pyrophosphate-dependent enzyme [Sporomusaceae bacterium]|nr:thiamine pyrophosphate-dependent enzyme [Sporomusaceae bacterium]